MITGLYQNLEEVKRKRKEQHEAFTNDLQTLEKRIKKLEDEPKTLIEDVSVEDVKTDIMKLKSDHEQDIKNITVSFLELQSRIENIEKTYVNRVDFEGTVDDLGKCIQDFVVNATPRPTVSNDKVTEIEAKIKALEAKIEQHTNIVPRVPSISMRKK